MAVLELKNTSPHGSAASASFAETIRASLPMMSAALVSGRLEGASVWQVFKAVHRLPASCALYSHVQRGMS